jgi:TP901 family phage tail tape measure protein
MAAGDLSLNIVIGAAMGGSFGATMGAVTSALQNISSGNVMGAVAAGAVAVGAAMVSATKDAGTYQQGLTSLVTGAGEAQSNLKAVGDGILNISTQTGTSTKSLTDAMYLIESSGQHGAAGLQVLQTAAEGAKVGNADLATTANALTTVLTDYHQPASAATGDMNALITAVADGKTHMQDMASSMGSVLPLASSLGISFPQVSGAIATMTNAGMDAQRASQNLANAIRSLAAPNAAAQKSMTEVGLSAQQLKDTLTTKGLAGAIQLIEDHVGKTFPAGSVQAVEAFKKIMGGATGYNVALMLGGQNMLSYEANIKNITSAMDAGGNSVQGWSLVQQDFNQKTAQAQAALQAFMIVLGEKLLPLLGPIVDGFTNVVEGLTQLVSGLSGATTANNGFVQALGSIGTGISDVTGAIGQGTQALQGFGSTAGQAISSAADTVGSAFSSMVSDAANWGSNLITSFVNGINSTIDSVTTTINQLVSSARTWGNNLIVSFGNGIIDAADAVLNSVAQIAQTISDYLGFASPTKKGPGSTLAKWGVGMVTGLAQGIIAAGPAITNAVLSVASQLQTASTSGGILHTAVASMIDPISGDAMTATATPNAAISHPSTGLNTTAVKSAASTSSHSAASTAATTAITTAVKSSATTVSTAVTTAATSAKAQKAATSAAAAAQRKAAAAQRTAHTAAMQKAHQQAAAQRAAHTAAMQKAHAAAAAQRQHAAQQRAAHTAAMQKAHQQAAQQRQAAAAQRAQQHAAAQAKREQIHQALLQQHAAAQAAKAAAKAGPPAVAGALPNLKAPTMDTGGIQAAAKNASTAIEGIKTAIQDVSKALSGIANSPFVSWLTKTKDGTNLLKAAIVGVGAALLATKAGAIASFIASLPGMLAGIGAWAAGMGAVALETIIAAAPFIAIGIVVAAVVFGILEAVTHWKDITKALTVAWQAVSTFFAGLWKGIQGIFGGIGQWFQDRFHQAASGVQAGLKAIQGFFGGIGAWFQGVLSALGTIVQNGMKAVSDFFSQAGKDIITAFNWLYNHNYYWKDLVDFINNTVSSGLSLLKRVWQDVVNFLVNLWNGIKSKASDAWKATSTAVGTATTNTIDALKTAWKDGTTALGNIWDGMKDFATTAWKDVSAIFESVWSTYISPALTSLWNSIHQAWVSFTTTVSKDAVALWQAVQKIFTTAWTTYISKPLTALWTNIQKLFTTWVTNFQTWAGNMLKGFVAGIVAGTQSVITVVTNLGAGIAKILGFHSPPPAGPLSTSDQWMPNFINMLVQGINAGVQSVVAAATNVANKIKSILGIQSPAQAGPLSTSDQWMPNLMSMFSKQITAGTPQVTSATNNMATQVQNSVDTMSNKVQQSVQDMMQKISAVGQSLSQMQSQVSSAIGVMRSDVQTATSDASMAISNMQSTMASSLSDMNQQIASVGQSIQQMQSTVNQAIAQAAQQVQNATASMVASLKSVTTEINSTATNAKTQENQLQKGMDTTVQMMNSSAKDISDALTQVSSYMKGVQADDQSRLAQAEADLAKAKADNNQMGALVAQMSVYANQAGVWLDQTLATAAQAAAAVMGHSTPKEGPMKNDDVWGVDFMQNFITGMQSQIPALANMSKTAATSIVENLLPNTQSMATDIKTALANAATATGDTITALKQKGDDITATIRQLSGLAGTAGSSGTYAITTANIAGDIPVSYQLTPPTPGTSGSQTTQNMTVHIDLDGKSIGKYVGTYISKEIHVQGAIRNR